MAAERRPGRHRLWVHLAAVALLTSAAAHPATRRGALTVIVEHGNEVGQLWALDALYEHGTAGLSGLMLGLASGRPAARARAAFLLGKLRASDALPGLLKALQDTELYVRGHACHALGSLGRAARVAIPELVALLHSPEPDLRSASCVALGKIAAELPPLEREPLREALRGCLKDGNEAIRRMAQEALEKSGPTSEDPGGVQNR